MMFAAMMAVLASCATAQDTKDIQLLAPNKDKGASIMKSLAQRQSHRECADKELSTADLSDLLWAANGINRPGDNKRTAPSALNRQDIDVYVISKTGAYKYIAAENRLQLIPKATTATPWLQVRTSSISSRFRSFLFPNCLNSATQRTNVHA